MRLDCGTLTLHWSITNLSALRSVVNGLALAASTGHLAKGERGRDRGKGGREVKRYGETGEGRGRSLEGERGEGHVKKYRGRKMDIDAEND